MGASSRNSRVHLRSFVSLITTPQLKTMSNDPRNGEKCTTETLDDLDAQLQEWYQQLGPELQYYGAAHASILLLQ